MILHIFMYNVISDFSAVTPASEGRVNYLLIFGDIYVLQRRQLVMLFDNIVPNVLENLGYFW